MQDPFQYFKKYNSLLATSTYHIHSASWKDKNNITANYDKPEIFNLVNRLNITISTPTKEPLTSSSLNLCANFRLHADKYLMGYSNRRSIIKTRLITVNVLPYTPIRIQLHSALQRLRHNTLPPFKTNRNGRSHRLHSVHYFFMYMKRDANQTARKTGTTAENQRQRAPSPYLDHLTHTTKTACQTNKRMAVRCKISTFAAQVGQSYDVFANPGAQKKSVSSGASRSRYSMMERPV